MRRILEDIDSNSIKSDLCNLYGLLESLNWPEHRPVAETQSFDKNRRLYSIISRLQKQRYKSQPFK